MMMMICINSHDDMLIDFFFANLHTHTPTLCEIEFFFVCIHFNEMKFLGHTLLETVYHLFFFGKKLFHSFTHYYRDNEQKKKVVIFFSAR